MRRTIRGGRPFFFADPATDKVLNMVVTLASEVWALRERLAAMEALDVRSGARASGEIDEYDFTPEQDATLAVQRKEFIDNLFRVLQEQAEQSKQTKQTKRSKQASSRPRLARTAKRARR
jgi:hypothetical protein